MNVNWVRNPHVLIVPPMHAIFRQSARLCRGGVAPILDVLPLQGAILFKPYSWGETQGVAALRSALPWAEIPLPLQGATTSKPPNGDGMNQECHDFKTSEWGWDEPRVP